MSGLEPLRLKLIIGKFQIISVKRGVGGCTFTLDLGNSIKFTADSPVPADVRVGDWLTFYTEVLADANTLPPPIQ